MPRWLIGPHRIIDVDEERMEFTSNTPWTWAERREICSYQAISSVSCIGDFTIKVHPSYPRLWLKMMAIQTVKDVVTRWGAIDFL